MASWTGYMLLGNGWKKTIDNVVFTHKADDRPAESIRAGTLRTGEVTEVMQFTAYNEHHDNWSVSFDVGDKSYYAELKDEGFKPDDEKAILFAQVTDKNDRFSLYFPVSKGADTKVTTSS